MRANHWWMTGCCVALLALAASRLAAGDLPNPLRGPTALKDEPAAPPIAAIEDKDVKRGRAYTGQPPTIPHDIEKYEITHNVNMCMYCHGRVRNAEFGAPMVSATHFMDRDYDFLAEVSPRRYFCTQCHVSQEEVVAPVKNTFMDVDQILERERASARQADGKP